MAESSGEEYEIAPTAVERQRSMSASRRRRVRWSVGAGVATLAVLAWWAQRKNGVEPSPSDWSDEGARWFNDLDWSDALYLLTLQEGEPMDEAIASRLRDSYSAATGHTW